MSDQIRRLRETKCYYDLDRYLFDQVTKRFKEEKTISAFDFYAIITWKANRAKTKVKAGLKSANVSPAALMTRVHGISDDREKMRLLDDVPGIGTPIASAILTVCYPLRFTVIDYRAWETLLDLKRVTSKTMPTTIDAYFKEYLPVCERLASEMSVPLRDLDLALWGWSQRRSIEALASE